MRVSTEAKMRKMLQREWNSKLSQMLLRDQVKSKCCFVLKSLRPLLKEMGVGGSLLVLLPRKEWEERETINTVEISEVFL